MNEKRVHSVLFPSFSDFEGEISASIFFSGCNFRCYFCFNANVVVEPPKLTLEQVLEFVESQIPLCSAAVLLGGEPLLHPLAALKTFLESLKKRGLRVKLFTNGTFPDKLKALLPLLDFVSLDIKHRLNSTSYRRVTSRFTDKNLESIIASIQLLRASRVPYEFRLTACAPIHSCEDVKALRKEFPELVVQDYCDTEEQQFKKFPLEALRC